MRTITGFIDRFFRLTENKTSIKTELVAGIATFLTMSYIIFLQPAVLTGALFGNETGMDFDAVMAATCIASAFATILMGLLAKYPIAQAPGMGENFFFVTTAAAASAAGFTEGWRVALGVVFISGLIFLAISLLKLRKPLMNAISPSMRQAIAVGIGLFIALIALKNANIVVIPGKDVIQLNTHFMSPDIMIFFFGLILTSVLYARKFKGAVITGILGTCAFAVLLKGVLKTGFLATCPAVSGSMLVNHFHITHSIFSTPPSIAPTLFKMDISGALSMTMLPFIVVFLFMDLFDTLGTLIGVGEQAGFIKDNELPRANQAMLSDAAGTVAGACLGTSSVTSFIESAAGVEAGGRTGLTGIVVGALFLLALFFSPLARMIGSYSVLTAPALVVVGAMMCKNVTKIDWSDPSEFIPAFITMLGIPLSYSIADGIALGFITYPVIKALSGRRKDVKWLSYVMAVVLLLYFVFIRS